jgi:hypothetical protein
MKRSDRASVAEETLRILQVGQYTTPSGRVVNLGKFLRRAKDGTCSYPPEAQVQVRAYTSAHRRATAWGAKAWRHLSSYTRRMGGFSA